MKKKIATILSLLTLTGCSLIPGRIEYLQKEVKPIPSYSAKDDQHQKQAAAFVAEKAQATKEAAVATKADVSVVVPATESALVAESLSTALGPPLKPYDGPAEKLAAVVEKDRAEVDRAIDKERERLQPLVGKDIEGTGLISMSWFTQIGIFLGLGLLIWAGLKVYGIFNPIVGAGLGAVERVSSKLAAEGFSATAQAIEDFKGGLQPGVQYTKDQVKEYLRTALQKRQDKNVQDLAYRLTRK